MNTAELKSDLHRLVVETSNVEILHTIRYFFLQLQAGDVDWWDLINDEQKKSIQISIKQLDKGNRLSHAQVRDKVNDLFKKHG